MKLSKKNAARQSAIQKAIASGKALGGLLVGFAAASISGGCSERSPSSIMGCYPMQQQVNAANENVSAVPSVSGAPPVQEPSRKSEAGEPGEGAR